MSPRRDLERVGPRRVGVRVVGLERDVVDADPVERLEPVPVLEEAAEDVVVVVGGRRLGHDVLHLAPRPVIAPHVVGPLEQVGEPADLALRVGQLQRGEAHEHPREQEVGEAGHGVVEAERGRDRDRRVARRGGHLRGRPDVHAQDGVRLLARGEERVPRARVDRRQPELGRDLAEAHRVHAARALRRTSSAASSASHSGTMISGIRCPPLSPHHSSTIQSLYASTHAWASSLSFASRKVCPQNRGNVGKQSEASTQFISMSSMRAFGS